MKRGDVAIADENFGMPADKFVIKQGEQTGSAITTADANDGPHAVVQEHTHQVRGAFAIAAGQEPETFARVARELDLEPKFLEHADAVINRAFVGGWAGRSDEADGIAGI